MADEYKNFQDAWLQVVDEAPDDPFLFIPTEGSSRVTTYRILSFYKRAVRMANVLRQQLDVPEGARVIMLVSKANETALIMHGCLLARISVMPVDPALPIADIAEAVRVIQPHTVISSPDWLDKLIDLSEVTPDIMNWVLTDRSDYSDDEGTLKYLDELLSSVDDLPDYEVSEDDCEAMVLRVDDPVKGVRFLALSQRTLACRAEFVAEVYPYNDDEKERACCSLPAYSFESLFHSFIVPVFSGVGCLVNRELDLRRFWDHVRTEGLSVAIIGQNDLRAIVRRGTPSGWRRPPRLQIMLNSESAISESLVSKFRDLFGIPLRTYFSLAEAGGVISMQSPASDPYKRSCIYEIYPSGVAAPGIDICICDGNGKEVACEEQGNVRIKTSCLSFGYIKNSGFEKLHLDSEGWLDTGYSGFFIEEDGSRQFYIAGRKDVFIRRGDLWVNPAITRNVLMDIRGVRNVKVIGFPNCYAGYEVGAVVTKMKASNLTADDIIELAAKELEWAERPKVVVLGECVDREGLPLKGSELEVKFDGYYNIDYGEFG